MVRFDDLRRPAYGTRLNHVWVESSLHQPLHRALGLFDTAGLFFENLDELVADDLAFLLWIADPGKFVEEAIGSIDSFEVKAEFIAQGQLHLLKFILA